MTGFASVLRYVAFTFMALFGLLGGLFVAGYAFEDPGGWTAVGMTALWVVPLAAMSVLALVRPGSAAPVFVAVTALVAAFTLADSAFGIVPRDDVGPVAAIAVFALVVALGFLGLRRPGLAGVLMIAAALSQLAATLVGFAVRDGSGEGPGPGAMLGGSSGVVVLPALVVGAMFLISGTITHESLRPGGTPRPRPAH